MKLHCHYSLLFSWLVLLTTVSQATAAPRWMEKFMERVLDRRSGDKPPFPSEFNGTPPASPPPSPPAGSRVVELHWIAGIREVQLPPSQHGQVAATPARAEEAEYVAEDSGESGEPSPENYAEAVDASDIFDEGPAFVRDGTSRAGWATLFVQIAMVMLGWFGFDAQANAECCGVTGPDERGRGSNRRDSEGRNRSENDDEPSFVDRVGGFFGRMFDDVAGEIMDVFGVDDEHFDGADTLPTSSKGLLTRWLPWVRSCKVRDLLPVVGDQGTRSDLGSLQKDLERLNLDAACMSTVHRIVAEFLERYPGIGYTQGMDRACVFILRLLGGDEASALEVFSSLAASTGRVISDPKGRVKAVGYAVGKSGCAMKDWLLGDKSLDMGGLSKEDAAGALYGHAFGRPLSSMCCMLELPESVKLAIVDKMLKAGIDAPAVSLWVTTALLSITRISNVNRTNTTEASLNKMCSTASATVRSLDDLRAAAPMNLSAFIRGYRKAMA